MNTSAKIEAILFFKGEPVSFGYIAERVGVGEEEVRAVVAELESSLTSRGLSIIRKDERVMLSTNPEASALIESIVKDDIAKELSKAGLETLSIVLYLGAISKAEIDYIRGVNSGTILRNLQVKGLVEKVPHPEGKKITLYDATFELLAHLGVKRREELPEYEHALEEIERFKREGAED